MSPVEHDVIGEVLRIIVRVEDGSFPQNDLLGLSCSSMVWAPRETLIALHREQHGEWGRRESHWRLAPES